MRDDVCVVEVGVHPRPYWRDANGGVTGPVCTRHRDQLNERASWDDEFGPYDWQPYEPEVLDTQGEAVKAPTFKMSACHRHFFKGHRWWCRGCDRETERQFREVVELWWSVSPDEQDRLLLATKTHRDV